MTGDDEDAINTSDKETVRIKADDGEEEEERPKRQPGKKGKKKRMWILLAIIIVIVIIVVPIAATFQMPTVDVVGAHITVSGTGPQKTHKLYATVQVYNPNMVGCTVQSITGTYYVNDAYGGDFQRTDQVSIAAASSTTFDIEVIPKSAVPVHATNVVQVKGTVNVLGAYTSWSVPFDESRDVTVP